MDGEPQFLGKAKVRSIEYIFLSSGHGSTAAFQVMSLWPMKRKSCNLDISTHMVVKFFLAANNTQ